jgi:hypothetical protein
MFRIRIALALGMLAVAGLLGVAAPAGASTASVTLTAGTLGFVTPPANVTFPSTALNGLNKTVTAAQAFDVGDATGAAAGWNITATSTTLTAGALTLPTPATTVASAPAAPTCDTGSTCTVGSPTTVTYPYSLPAATTAPTATKMYNAPAGTGMGNQTLTPTWTLSIPSSAQAGTYTSTWTQSLVSGP